MTSIDGAAFLEHHHTGHRPDKTLKGDEKSRRPSLKVAKFTWDQFHETNLAFAPVALTPLRRGGESLYV